MSSSQKVFVILLKADSKKVSEKKEFVQNLSDILTNEEIIQDITHYSRNQEPDRHQKVTWNTIFIKCHQFLIDEIGKSGPLAAKSSLQLQNDCCTLLSKIARHACTPFEIFLNFKDLKFMLFEVLESDFYKNAYNTYINLLTDVVLSNRMHRVLITYEEWSNMLQIFCKMYEESHVRKDVALQVLQQTIYYGCLQSRLVHDVKLMLPFLSNVFDDVINDPTILLKPAYKLMYTVCTEIATESRKALCNFSEKILPRMIAIEGDADKYKLLLFFIVIHHPNGATSDEKSAYAHDWKEWKHTMIIIYNHILKNIKYTFLFSSFTALASEVFKQILEDHIYREEASSVDPETSLRIKRQRLSSEIQKLPDFFNINFDKKETESRWCISKILKEMIEKYPNVLNKRDFQVLLELVSELFAETIKNEQAVDSLCELSKTLLKTEHILSDGLMFTEITEKYWTKIQHILLRILGLKQNEKEGHELLQLLITNFNTLSISELLYLYINNEIPWSSFSINTLYVICQHVNITHYIEEYRLPNDLVKNRLINWILNIPSCRAVKSDTILSSGKVLIYLILKTWFKDNSNVSINQKIFQDNTNTNDNTLFDLLANISKYYLSLSLELDIFKTDDVSLCTINSNDNTKLIQPILSEETLSSIVTKLCELLDDHEKNVEGVSKLIYDLSIVATFISSLLEINVERNHKELEKLLNSFTRSIASLYKFIYENDLLNRKHMYIIDLIRALITLYETPYSHTIATIIIEQCPLDFLRKLLELVNFENKEELGRTEEDLGIKYFECIFDIRDNSQCKQRSRRLSLGHIKVSDDHAITIGAHKIIALFGCIDSGGKIFEIQQKLLENILQVEIYAPTVIGNFWQASLFLQTLTKCREDFFSKEFINKVIEFLNQLTHKWKRDYNAVKGITEILPLFCKHLTFVGETMQTILEIFLYTHHLILANRFGSAVCLSFLKSLHQFIQVKSSLEILSKDTTQKTITINDVLLRYIGSAFFVVRFETIKIIHDIFQSKTLEIPKKTSFLETIKESVLKLFDIQDISSKQDEWNNIISTTLYTLGSIINSSGFFQTNVLIFMLNLHGEREVPINMILKTLDIAVKNENYKEKLINMNLYTLMKNWMDRKYSQTFPWMITQSTSEEEFFKDHMSVFILIKLEAHQLTVINTICEKLGCPFPEVIETNFSTVIVWILSTISQASETESQSHKQYARHIFEQLKKNQDKFEGIKKLSYLIENQLNKILINIIERFHDIENFTEMFHEQYNYIPSINPPNLNSTSVGKCLHYLEKLCPVFGNSLISYLTNDGSNILQQVLLMLSNNIYESPMIEHKLLTFHQYAFFCNYLIQEISKVTFDTMAMFFLKDICYTLLHLINKETEKLSNIIAGFFYTILKTSLPSRSEEISRILDFIVVSLISAIQKNKIDDIGLKIIHFLITYSTDPIKLAVLKLDKFPSDSCFDKIRSIHSANKHFVGDLNLQKEIKIFLDLKNEKITTYNYEVISELAKVLHDKKDELIQMYKDLEKLHGFTEDCRSSLLHRLIYKLMKLTENSNEIMFLEIAKCLGELGPANLTTMILHSEEHQAKEDGNFEEIFIYKIIILLIKFLESNNIQLKMNSASALHQICSTSQGKNILTPKYLKDNDEASALMLLNLTQPFINKNETINDILRLNKKHCNIYINSQYNLWKNISTNSYTEWILSVSCKILHCFDNSYFSTLIPICKLNIEFAEWILPKLIYLIILTDDKIADRLCKSIDRFFEQNFNSFNDTINSNQFIDSSNHKSMKCVLNVINFIRIQCGDNFMLKLNYLYVAKAAQLCSAYFSAIFYAELYCETLKQSIDNTDNNEFNIDYICEEIDIETGKTLQKILWEAFTHIGDPDSIHGCGLSHLKNLSSRIQYYTYLQQWDKVIIAVDAELSSGLSNFNDMTIALQNSGFNYLLSRFSSTLRDDENMDKNIYETAWRLSDWNIIPNKNSSKQKTRITKNLISDDHDYHYYHYEALKSLHENDYVSLQEYINNARIGIIKSFHNISLECSETIYPKLVKLQMLLELEQMAGTNEENLEQLISSWKSQNVPNLNDFVHVEPILTQRTVLFKAKYSVNHLEYLNEAFIDTCLQLSEIAEMQGHTKIAARILISLATKNNLPTKIQHQLQYRDALLNWTKKDFDIARYLMKDLINKSELESGFYANILRIYGNWMAETKSENPQNIIDKYYKKSIDILSRIKDQSIDCINNLNDTYAALAQFSDTQYQQITAFMKTPGYESLKECTQYAKNNITKITKNKDVKRALDIFKKQNQIDVAEYTNIKKEQKFYLERAIQYYLTTLETGDNHNFFIFRIISLWLNNKDNETVNELFENQLEKIPCYKFIPLIPQLAPHLSETRNNTFKSQIYQLLKRCTEAHPHHTLPILLALVNTRKDYDFQEKKDTKVDATERELGAKCLISEFRDNKIYPIIQEMINVAEALIMLAYHEFNDREAAHRIPNNQKINRIKNYRYSMVPTITPSIEPTGKYSEVISIYKYEDCFEGVGGVNKPKKIVCIGTDGIRRKQLVKGKDDLKQDAVMQQVFTVMNLLLVASKETKRRKLNIRTYKVVPLSQRSGVLEWCDNSLPIMAILNRDNKFSGMHNKYYSNDWSLQKCREKIKEAAANNSVLTQRKKIYLECCKHIHPVLHLFFMNTFPSPEVWFERRLAFVRSVATNSMVGYILGLGDRHFNNILIDELSAEVIHIDFGIAFEQGKVLPTPETVPFRLTRNIEAAMGVSGIEGVMRKCSEETMTVLRNRKDIIITLLQVLLYDPLFSWMVTPALAWELQNDGMKPKSKQYDEDIGNDKFNKVAEKALLRLEQKLQGTEDGLQTSIPGQVERLIQEARDPANLCRLFYGWQAYL
ncbi:serine-protein kinase ATM [Chelonus insularis]|uniref:serine-protein kinase ATM n=1 Tax=Chelonus insularis TaxID=460826 RepID=UPI00158879A7|nr:serine-protein kinase ATM [Chelonus insularis]